MPSTLAEPPQRPPALWRETHPRVAPVWIGRLLLRLIIIGGITALLLLGWYLAQRGFDHRTRNIIVEELRKVGVEASIQKLKLDPFRGLVAEKVRIFEGQDRRNTIALVSEIVVEINYGALLHRQPFLNALQIRDGQVTLPLAAGVSGKARPQLSDFSARVYFPPEYIDVSQAEGVFAGLRISAKGQLVKPESYKPTGATAPEEWRRRLELVQRIAAELNKVRFPEGEPTLQITFAGNVAEMEHARLTALLAVPAAERGGYRFQDFAARAEWAGRRLIVPTLEWNDHAGTVSAAFTWAAVTGDAELRLRSTADAVGLLKAMQLGEDLRELRVNGSQMVELSGSRTAGDGAPRQNVMGRITLGDFTFHGVAFDSLAGDFGWDGKRTMLRDLLVRQRTGELRAELLDAPGEFRVDLESSISPAAATPLIPEGLRKFWSEWEWTTPPSVKMAISGQDRDAKSWTGEGRIVLPRTRFRGVWLNEAVSDVRLEGGAVSYDNFRIVRDEGIATGSFTYDFANKEVRLNGVESTLWPVEAIHWVDPKMMKHVAPYRFLQPPRVNANGVVQFGGGRNTRLDLRVDASGGMLYTFLKKELPFESAAGDLLFTDERLELVEVRGQLFNGVVRATADISLEKGNPRHHAAIKLTGIDFPHLTDLYFSYRSSQGELSGTYEFNGFGDNVRAMEGKGDVKIVRGDIFAIPIFGPLSKLIAAIIPGTGYSIARKATATFTVDEGVIRTNDLEIAGNLFSMLGRGRIDFLDDKIEMDMRLDASGLGVVLTPVYKFFEYRGEGSLKDPRWHAKNF